MIYLTRDEVIQLQAAVVARSGGGTGILDLGKIDSAVAPPRMTFGGQDLYPTLAEKSAALGFSLACNHGFVDGNKRIGHAAMETFLVLNGHEIDAPVDEQERVFLTLAAAQMTREEFTTWVQQHVRPLGSRGSHGS
ncbi:type II toxin-antitoxin system death-on-curing family toxin [Limnoglobus roseus]|uniref:Toxin Doc n=1 Tax=Limnoglobus roseus TaxID=2598579 RepID=A0A5C1A7W1_9BACT|nr:type II toxin-antitoxin system death-on-curing family toxin [Limnoglobus roseus]QEL15281.1 Toxin Doc [Limnoglobus roseus]